MRRERWCDPRRCGGGDGSGEEADEGDEAMEVEVVVVEADDNQERFVFSPLKPHSDG